MNKKIAVYAICKNEEKNILSWYESMKEADEIIVLDTGSTDKTIELLQKCRKIKVFKQVINPWRFDVARNISLSYVSENIDICICTDLDERFEPGWSIHVKKYWKDDTTRGRYLYNWNFMNNGEPGTTFYINKAHVRHGYIWTHPVHEVLSAQIEEKEILIPNLILNHYQDLTKKRTSYLPLLELSVQEDPRDDRNMHYLAREYMYYHKYNEAIQTFHRHLNLPSSTWKDERCASMRYLGFCYKKINYYEESIMWYEKAIKEAPYLREPYYDISLLMYELKRYDEVIKYLNKAIKIKEKSLTYINEQDAWNETIYDLLAIAYYEVNNINLSYRYSKKAYKINSKNERIKNNYEFIKKIKKA